MAKIRLLSGERIHVLDVNASSSGDVTVRASSGGDDESHDSPPREHHVYPGGSGTFSVLSNGGAWEAQVELGEESVTVSISGERFVFERADVRRAQSGAGRVGGEARVRAPMPGKVVKLLVDAGETVEAGQGILLFEAMKMQNEVKSPVAGAVKSVSVQEGQAVESKQDLFTVSPSDI